MSFNMTSSYISYQTTDVCCIGLFQVYYLSTCFIGEEFIVHDLSRLCENNSEFEIHGALLLLQPENVFLNIWVDNFSRNFLYLIQVAKVGQELKLKKSLKGEDLKTGMKLGLADKSFFF